MFSLTQAAEACNKFGVEMTRDGRIFKASLKLKESLDYETRKSYQMYLQAMVSICYMNALIQYIFEIYIIHESLCMNIEKDAGVPSRWDTVLITITVLDIQDGGPRFLNAPLAMIAYENVPQVRTVLFFSLNRDFACIIIYYAWLHFVICRAL